VTGLELALGQVSVRLLIAIFSAFSTMLHLYAMLAIKAELGHVGIEHAYVLSQFKLLARLSNVKI